MFFVPGTIDTNKSHMQGKGILQGVEHNSALKISQNEKQLIVNMIIP